MRLWSIHPSYLDSRGLTALWREALLAQKVLAGKTRGYRYHPQLERFRQSPWPRAAISSYLKAVYKEASRRGYCFSRDRIVSRRQPALKIKVSRGQLTFEFRHLLKKLKTRDPLRYRSLRTAARLRAHPLFTVVSGPVACWEKNIR